MQKEELRSLVDSVGRAVTQSQGESSSPMLGMAPTSKNKQPPPNINAKGRIKPALYYHLKSLQKRWYANDWDSIGIIVLNPEVKEEVHHGKQLHPG